MKHTKWNSTDTGRGREKTSARGGTTHNQGLRLRAAAASGNKQHKPHTPQQTTETAPRRTLLQRRWRSPGIPAISSHCNGIPNLRNLGLTRREAFAQALRSPAVCRSFTTYVIAPHTLVPCSPFPSRFSSRGHARGTQGAQLTRTCESVLNWPWCRSPGSVRKGVRCPHFRSLARGVTGAAAHTMQPQPLSVAGPHARTAVHLGPHFFA